MRIKINTCIVGPDVLLKKGDVVDAAAYKSAERWIKAGYATVIEEIETAAIEQIVETATAKRGKRGKKTAQ